MISGKIFTPDNVGEFANRFNVPRYVVCVPSGPQIIPGKLKFLCAAVLNVEIKKKVKSCMKKAIIGFHGIP